MRDRLRLPPAGLHPLAGSAAGPQRCACIVTKVKAALRLRARQRHRPRVLDIPTPRFGIVTTGKAYLDVLQALEDARA
jgi:indolepyruvate ferredoxin oxidoreductase